MLKHLFCLVPVLVLAAMACAENPKGKTLLYGNAFLYEEGFSRDIWKGGESASREHGLEGRKFTSAKAS